MKLHVVKKARKPTKCGRCGVEIKKGDPYRWFKGRYTAKKDRCMKPSCNFRQSEMTGSDKLADVYSAQEDLSDTLDELDKLTSEVKDEESAKTFADDVREALESAANAIREVAGAYEESASNIEEHFPSGTPQSEECQEKASELEEWADELEGASDEVDEPEPEEDDGKVTAAQWGAYAEELLATAHEKADSCPV